MLNIGVCPDGGRILYTSPSHMDALKTRLTADTQYLPKAANAGDAASRVRPSAGVSFERRQARDLTGEEDLADFAIIGF